MFNSIFDNQNLEYKPQEIKVDRISSISDSLNAPNPKKSVVVKNNGGGLYEQRPSLIASQRSNEVTKNPEFDLKRIYAIQLNEEMFQISVQKIVERLMNGGIYLKSRNNDTVKYLNDRIDYLADSSGSPWRSIVDTMLRQFITGSNCFIYKNRSSDTPNARKVRLSNSTKTIDPIKSIEVLDSSSIYPIISRTSQTVKRWVVDHSYSNNYENLSLSDLFFSSGVTQEVSSTYKSQDIGHFYLNRIPGYVFGCPYIIPTIPDIIELRKLEELMGIIAYQRAYPLIHIKVGNENNPAYRTQDGIEIEVDQMAAKFEGMPLEGVFTTNERVEIKSVLDNYDPSSLKPLVDHYKKRSEEGLGLSSIDRGDNSSTSRSSAFELTKEGVGRATYTGSSFTDFLDYHLIHPMLREGGIDPSDKKRTANIVFSDLDQSSRIGEENHSLSLYQSNVITEDEMRESIGKYPITNEERKKLFVHTVKEIESKIEAANSIKENKSDSSKETKSQQNISGSNQHGGKKVGKPKKD